jgi:hypothetical protein
MLSRRWRSLKRRRQETGDRDEEIGQELGEQRTESQISDEVIIASVGTLLSFNELKIPKLLTYRRPLNNRA